MEMAKEGRQKGKNKVTLPTCTIDPELLQRLDAFCLRASKYRSNAVEDAIEEYLDKKEREEKKVK
jgi:metal-responsive CopG/Arc/MetJ family transcriptional regulator